MIKKVSRNGNSRWLAINQFLLPLWSTTGVELSSTWHERKTHIQVWKDFFVRHGDFVNIERASMNTQKGLLNFFPRSPRPFNFFAFHQSIGTPPRMFFPRKMMKTAREKIQFLSINNRPRYAFFIRWWIARIFAFYLERRGEQNELFIPQNWWKSSPCWMCSIDINSPNVCAQTESFFASLLLRSSNVCSLNEKANSKKLFARLRFLFCLTEWGSD